MIAPPALVPTADPLAPVRETLIQMAARPHAPAVAGIAPGLTVTDPHDWVPAADLVAGVRLDELLASAAQRWQAAPHAAAALAWKSYSFWLALPAVLGYAAARRVPLLRPDSVVVRWSTRQPFLTVGLTAAVEVAILPNDPLALSGAEGGRPSCCSQRLTLGTSAPASIPSGITLSRNFGSSETWKEAKRI